MVDWGAVGKETLDSVKTIGMYVLYAAIAAIAIGGVAYKRKQKQIFKYPVRVFRRRENGKRKEINYVGGYLKDQRGFTFFRIKTGKMPWQKKDMYQLPDANAMDEEDRVYYEAYDPDNWVQVRRFFMTRKTRLLEIQLIKPYGQFPAGTTGQVLEDLADQLVSAGVATYTNPDAIVEVDANDAYYEPIPSDRKAMVANELSTAKATLGVDSWKSTAMWVGGSVLIIVSGLIAYYFVSNKGLT